MGVAAGITARIITTTPHTLISPLTFLNFMERLAKVIAEKRREQQDACEHKDVAQKPIGKRNSVIQSFAG